MGHTLRLLTGPNSGVAAKVTDEVKTLAARDASWAQEWERFFESPQARSIRSTSERRAAERRNLGNGERWRSGGSRGGERPRPPPPHQPGSGGEMLGVCNQPVPRPENEGRGLSAAAFKHRGLRGGRSTEGSAVPDGQVELRLLGREGADDQPVYLQYGLGPL